MELPDEVAMADIVGLIRNLTNINTNYRGVDVNGFDGTGILVSNVPQLLIKSEFIDMRGYTFKCPDDLRNIFYDDVVLGRLQSFENTDINFEKISLICEYGIDMDLIVYMCSKGYRFSINGYDIDHDELDYLEPGCGFIRLPENSPIDKIFNLIKYLRELKETNRVEQTAKIESVCIALCNHCDEEL